MIAMTFTIELDIGLSYLLQAALALAGDRSREENSLSWAVKAIVRPLPAPHRDPGSGTANQDAFQRNLCHTRKRMSSKHRRSVGDRLPGRVAVGLCVNTKGLATLRRWVASESMAQGGLLDGGRTSLKRSQLGQTRT